VEPPACQDNDWIMVIETERDGMFSNDNDPIGLLKQDLDKVPIITGLDEKTPIKQGLIRTTGTSPNTVVTVLR
jgi:hypothetical protein